MEKNKIDYKLVNMAILAFIIYIAYSTSNLWFGIIGKICNILVPFLFAFAVAYAMYPFLEKMKGKVPKGLGVFIIILGILALLAIVVYIIATLLVGQLSSFFDSIMAVIKDLSNMDFDISFAGLETDLSETFKNILSSVGNYVSNGTISVIDNSISALSRILIGFAAFVYFLIDMDHIRNGIKNFLKNYSMKMFDYVKELDDQMKRYLNGLVRIMVISVIEYTFAYTIIGHPNAILLGLLAGFGNLIPYFGGMANNCLAAITALAISPSLFIKTIILFVILSWVDGYVINPTVYGKTNSIHPLIVILSVFAGGILWGIMGIVISFPVAIIIVTTYKFFRNDISNITTKKRNKKIKLTNK